MKRMCRYLPLLYVALLCILPVEAQSTVDINMGFGSPQDSANAGLDSSSASLSPCNSSTPTGTCVTTPALGGFMMGFGANAMLWKKFGIGGEANFQATKPNYADLSAADGFVLKSRVTLYDFNGIYQPVNTEKATLQLIGGIGGANIKFYQGMATNSLIGNSAYGNYAIASANHFQIHAGVGVQLYVHGNFFIRPQFDFHYVPNFIQFGHNYVTQEMVWVGYSIGERQ